LGGATTIETNFKNKNKKPNVRINYIIYQDKPIYNEGVP
jgi:hypothetical protein